MNAGSRADIDDSVIIPSSSIVPTWPMVDEVSMTKITLRPDHAALAAHVLQLDHGGVWSIQPVAPFHDHRSLIEQLVEAEISQLRRCLDSVQVDMRELHLPRVDAHQLERRAGHWSDRGCAAGYAAHEG